MVNPNSHTSIVQLMINIVTFFILSIVIGTVVSKGITRFAQGSVWRDRIVTFAIILCFAFAFAAELFSVAAITGAYFAGVALAATPYRHRVVNKIQSFAFALFTPIFFCKHRS